MLRYWRLFVVVVMEDPKNDGRRESLKSYARSHMGNLMLDDDMLTTKIRNDKRRWRVSDQKYNGGTLSYGLGVLLVCSGLFVLRPRLLLLNLSVIAFTLKVVLEFSLLPLR